MKHIKMSVFRVWAPGSFTVEAAYVFGIALLVIGSLIRQAFVMHDRTAANMILQEAVETGRRAEETGNIQAAEADGMAQVWLLYDMEDYRLRLTEDGQRVSGTGEAEGFSNGISLPCFDPENFLRMIEGLSGLGGYDDGG